MKAQKKPSGRVTGIMSYYTEQSKLRVGEVIDNDVHFGQTERFFEHARKFDTEITKAEVKTVFMMTWSVRDQPNEQAILTHAYTTIAKELDSYFSKASVLNEIDLSSLELMMESFRSNIVKDGYAKAALKHYKQYSKLIGETYKP